MKLISDKDVAQKADWETLGEITWGVWGAVGIGLTFGFRVGWWDGKLGYEAKMGVVLKLGAGTSIKGTVAPIKIGQFLYTIAVSVDWLKLSDIFESKVHSLFDSFMRDCLFTEKTIEDVVKDMKDHLPQIMSATTEVLEQEFGVLKAVDDSFDHYIPGYSGYKKHSATFWLLKSTYNFLREINTAKSIKDNTITQVNFIEQGKRWKYATWQMKVNFVTDMTQGMGVISRYSESERQRAMLAVFRSARNSSEFQKMHLCVTNADELFEDTYKVEFDNLKIKFK